MAKKSFKRFDTPVCIHIISRRNRLADPDGISGKAAVDGIVNTGILPDDSSKQIEEVTYKQVKTEGEEGTTIIIGEAKHMRETLDIKVCFRCGYVHTDALPLEENYACPSCREGKLLYISTCLDMLNTVYLRENNDMRDIFEKDLEEDSDYDELDFDEDSDPDDYYYEYDDSEDYDEYE